MSNVLNGGQIIVDYLIREKVPYAFGLCGHGNIGFIDALYERSERHQDHLCASRGGGRLHGRRLLPGLRPADRDLHLLRTGFREPADRARQRLSRFGAVHGHHRQRADEPVQQGRLPGALSPPAGRFSLHRARLLQARVPAHSRRDGADRRAAGLENHGDRPARPGGARRSVRHLQGGGGRGKPAPARSGRRTFPRAAAPTRKAS